MSILNNNNKEKGKQGKKDQKAAQQGSKFITKQGKSSGFAQKPHRSGGTRGS